MSSGTFYPSVSGDDGYYYGTSFSSTAIFLYLGKPTASDSAKSWIRFLNVTIPQNSVITNAFVRLSARHTRSTTTVNVDIFFNNIDNAVAPTSIGEVDALALTSAISWNNIAAWTVLTQYDTPDLASILQTVISRGGWSSGQALQVVIKDDGSTASANRTASSVDFSSGDYKAELHVTWTTSAVYEETLTESMAFSDSVVPDHYVEIITELANLSDAVVPDHYVEIIAEAIALNDTILTEGIYSIALSENVNLNDSVIPDHYIETLVENVDLDDLIFTEATYNVAIAESVACDDVVTPDHYVETLAEAANLSDAYERFLEFERIITENVRLVDDIDAFNWTQWLIQNEYRAVKQYYLTLTGSADSKSDVVLPMKSFQGRLRDSDPTYLSCVIPGVEYASQINDRPNGDLIVEMAYLIDGIEQYKEQLAAVDLETIKIDEGTKNQSITLSGHRTESFAAKNVILDGASYYYLSGGKYYYRLAKLDMYLKPGDIVEVNDDSFTVETVSYFVSVERQQMDIAE